MTEDDPNYHPENADTDYALSCLPFNISILKGRLDDERVTEYCEHLLESSYRMQEIAYELHKGVDNGMSKDEFIAKYNVWRKGRSLYEG